MDYNIFVIFVVITFLSPRHSGAISLPAAEIDSVMPFPIAEIIAWIAASPADFSPGFRLMVGSFCQNVLACAPKAV